MKKSKRQWNHKTNKYKLERIRRRRLAWLYLWMSDAKCKIKNEEEIGNRRRDWVKLLAAPSNASLVLCRRELWGVREWGKMENWYQKRNALRSRDRFENSSSFFVFSFFKIKTPRTFSFVFSVFISNIYNNMKIKLHKCIVRFASIIGTKLVFGKFQI